MHASRNNFTRCHNKRARFSHLHQLAGSNNNMALQNLCLIFLFGVPSLTVAFGPPFDPLKGGYGARTSLKTVADNDEEVPNVGSGKRGVTSYTLHYENRYEEVDGEFFQSRLFISEPFILDASLFGIVNPYDIQAGSEDDDVFAACGEDCEECAIPDEYKRVASDNSMDVMAYLGIRRAQPIRLASHHHSAGDWE
jgi:hypothetical protein